MTTGLPKLEIDNG